MTPLVLVAGVLALLFFLNRAADRVRGRVYVERSAQRLAIRGQQAALRMDAVTLMVLLASAGYAAITRSPALFVLAAGSSVVVGWRICQTRSAPVFVFDRTADAVLKNARPLCSLAAIEALEITGVQPASLHLRHRGSGGALREQRLYRGRPTQAAEVRRAIADFLAARSP